MPARIHAAAPVFLLACASLHPSERHIVQPDCLVVSLELDRCGNVVSAATAERTSIWTGARAAKASSIPNVHARKLMEETKQWVCRWWHLLRKL